MFISDLSRHLRLYTPYILLLLVAAVTGTGLYLSLTKEVPAQGGTHVEAEIGIPRAINPLLSHFNDVDEDLVELVFAGLTRLDKDGEVLPSISDRWEISENGLDYTFHINQQAKWQDGEPITPDDVVFTVQTLQSKGFPGSPELAATWKSVKVEKVDGEKVRFSLPAPLAPFLSYTNLGIIPKHLLQDIPVADTAQAKFNAFPVGSGRFMVTKAESSSVTLKSNPFSLNGQPFLEELRMLFFSDEASAVAAVKSGKARGVMLSREASAESANVLAREKGMRGHKAVGANYAALFFNSKSKFFQDEQVRKALLLALDRESLVKEVTNGQGQPSDSPIVPQTWAYSPEAGSAEPDQRKAAEMLDQTGWKINGAGVRAKDGVEFKFSLRTNDNKVRVALAEGIARQLGPLGIKVEPTASDPSGLLQNFIIPRRFDAVLYGLDTGYDPDGFPVWHSSQDKEDGLNISSFSEPLIDSVLERARTTSDPAERKNLYKEFQRLFLEKVPGIILYYPIHTYWVDETVKGIEMGVLFEPSSRFFNIEEWYMKTKRVLKSAR